ncbi:hypothetical protein [Janthinobacterium sp. PSPC2-1]|uniref:hypothetical protein n=1 Tax=unclassified Janthinobacterium TaxID=2610881 RepID=UPI003CF53719
MPLQLKDIAKLNQIIERIQAGNFDENDVDNLLMKLRAYAGKSTVFLEVAHFVAHSDARDRGIAHQSITAIVDSIQYFREFLSVERQLNVSKPFPAYIYRLFLSQSRLTDERQLREKYKMSRSTLIKKIEASFLFDKKTNTYCLRGNKGGIELLESLHFITSFIHAKPAFHIRDFHKELKDVMRTQKVIFDEAAWDAQAATISLAILCLVSNTEFALDNGNKASCKIETENHFRLISGQRRLPTGLMSSEPTNFGTLRILGKATINSTNIAPVSIMFPLIDTDLDPREHCDPSLFLRDKAPEDFGDGIVEIINFAADMSLTNDFRLVQTQSLVQ